MIAQSKTPLERGGYSRVSQIPPLQCKLATLMQADAFLQVCNAAEQSIRSVLSTNNNAADLLALHRRSTGSDEPHMEFEESPGRIVVTK